MRDFALSKPPSAQDLTGITISSSHFPEYVVESITCWRFSPHPSPRQLPSFLTLCLTLFFKIAFPFLFMVTSSTLLQNSLRTLRNSALYLFCIFIKCQKISITFGN